MLRLKNRSDSHHQNLVQVLNEMKYEIAKTGDASGNLGACYFCLCECSPFLHKLGGLDLDASDSRLPPPTNSPVNTGVSLWDMQSSGKTHGWHTFPISTITVIAHVVSEVYHRPWSIQQKHQKPWRHLSPPFSSSPCIWGATHLLPHHVYYPGTIHMHPTLFIFFKTEEEII